MIFISKIKLILNEKDGIFVIAIAIMK